MIRFFPFLLILTSCSSYIASMQEEKKRSDIAYDEMRIEISDLQHALKTTQVELSILEERIKKQDAVLAKKDKNEILLQQMAALEKKNSNLQSTLEQLTQEMQKLKNHANETSLSLQTLAHEIQSQNKKFEEIAKLKTLMSSLPKLFEPKDEKKVSTHRVKPGETLEKIARLYNTTVSELKQLNHLENDLIVVGQDLQIP